MIHHTLFVKTLQVVCIDFFTWLLNISESLWLFLALYLISRFQTCQHEFHNRLKMWIWYQASSFKLNNTRFKLCLTNELRLHVYSSRKACAIQHWTIPLTSGAIHKTNTQIFSTFDISNLMHESDNPPSLVLQMQTIHK